MSATPHTLQRVAAMVAEEFNEGPTLVDRTPLPIATSIAGWGEGRYQERTPALGVPIPRWFLDTEHGAFGEEEPTCPGRFVALPPASLAAIVCTLCGNIHGRFVGLCEGRR